MDTEQVNALWADSSRLLRARLSPNFALKLSVLQELYVSWAFPPPRQLQLLAGYLGVGHNARA